MDHPALQQLKMCFPRSETYRSVSENQLAESQEPFRHFSYQERHLQCVWADQRYRPKHLKTTTNEDVIVEHPGDWNLEAGPDFLQAILKIGPQKRRVCGDLEVHIHPSGWRLHGHNQDPHYNHVRFHLTWFQGPEFPELIQIPLQPLLSADPLFSFESIDTTAYPYAVPSGPFPLKSMPPDQKIELLESAGEQRLRLKAERLLIALTSKDPHQLLWEELMVALGYKNNKAPFRKLATRLPLARLKSLNGTSDEIYALLAGLSGLLPPVPETDWDDTTRAFYRQIWDHWWRFREAFQNQQLARSDWNLRSLRPANHPLRRLRAAADYVQHIPSISLPGNESLLTTFAPNYWSNHIGWNSVAASSALVGSGRANTIVTNLLVPWRAAVGLTDLQLNHLPNEPLNRIIRQTAFALFGPDHPPCLYRTPLARQGLIQIFYDYVLPRRLDTLKLEALPA